MGLRTKYCEGRKLSGMEKSQRNVVFGLQVFEDEENMWGLRRGSGGRPGDYRQG